MGRRCCERAAFSARFLLDSPDKGGRSTSPRWAGRSSSQRAFCSAPSPIVHHGRRLGRTGLSAGKPSRPTRAQETRRRPLWSRQPAQRASRWCGRMHAGFWDIGLDQFIARRAHGLDVVPFADAAGAPPRRPSPGWRPRLPRQRWGRKRPFACSSRRSRRWRPLLPRRGRLSAAWR